MNQQEYIRYIEELTLPAAKALEWVQVLEEKYYDEFSEMQRVHLESIFENSQKLVNLIPKMKLLTSEIDRLEAITHGLAGPIVAIRDYTKLILLSFKTQSADVEKEYEEYLMKINVTAQYLWILNRDTLLKMHQDSFNDE